MRRAGYILMLLAVLIAAFGMAQLAWAINTSPDPNPNQPGSGMLMTACWFGGIILFGVGGWMAGVIRRPLI